MSGGYEFKKWLRGPVRSYIWDEVGMRAMDEIDRALWDQLWDNWWWYIPWQIISAQIWDELNQHDTTLLGME